MDGNVIEAFRETFSSVTEDERVAILNRYKSLLTMASTVGEAFLDMLLEGRGEEAKELMFKIFEANIDEGTAQLMGDDLKSLVLVMDAMSDTLGHKIED